MKLLEPLKEATQATTKDKFPTLSKMMPYFDQLLDHFSSVQDKLTGGGNQRQNGQFLINEDTDNAVDAAEQKILKYFEVSSDLAIVAAILDPRLRMEYYQNESESDIAYTAHLAIFKRYKTPHNSN